MIMILLYPYVKGQLPILQIIKCIHSNYKFADSHGKHIMLAGAVSSSPLNWPLTSDPYKAIQSRNRKFVDTMSIAV